MLNQFWKSFVFEKKFGSQKWNIKNFVLRKKF